ncbi:MAG: class I SAM-dependent methyltransferase [Amphiplicatus sp.]
MTEDLESYRRANEAKAKFDEIYNAPDPRAYYTTLAALDYRIPTEARPVFQRLIRSLDKARPKVVDVGCSYGVNAAMIRHDLAFDDLARRYAAPAMQAASTAEVILEDARLFADLPRSLDAVFVGVDVANEAAGYAKSVGLIEEAIVENLEIEPLYDPAPLADADLLITTGAVGYVTDETFAKLIDAAKGPPPMVAAFVLRQFPFDDIAARLEDYGLVARKLEGRYFPQRRFRDAAEAEAAVEAVCALGLDPAGLEAEGRYYAELYFAAPGGGPRVETLLAA